MIGADGRRGLDSGLEWGVPGVKVSELASNVEHSDITGLLNALCKPPGGINLPLELISSTIVSPKSSGNITTCEPDESILIVGTSEYSGSQSVSHVAIGACFAGAKKLANSDLLSSLSIDSSLSNVVARK